jgi:antitoxin PrlF
MQPIELSHHPVTASLTEKGQVTIPVHIRRLLGLAPRDTVAFLVREGQVQIAPAQSVIARTAGMLTGEVPAVATQEEKTAAETAMADEAQGRSRNGG